MVAVPTKKSSPSLLNKKSDPEKHESENRATEPLKPSFSRRAFLARIGATGIAASAAPLLRAVPVDEVQTPSAAPATSSQAVPVVLKVNGQEHQLRLEPRVTLLDALRENLQMFGTKKGCDHGQCGACTLHVNGRRVNSCLSFAIMHQGDEITTIEGLAKDGQLHPVQAAFLEHDGFQCGYCTPGQIMSATALLKEPCGADDDSVRECMSGNICRCGAYPNIVAAVQEVRRRT